VDVAPFVFHLVASSPKELAGNSVIKNVADTISKRLDLIIREEGGVASALSIPDGGAVALAIGSKSGSSAVKVDSVLFGEVRVGAVYPFAVELVLGVGVVESSEPEGADVSGEGPLSNPDGVLNSGEATTEVVSVVVAVAANIVLAFPPGHVLMSVHDNIFHIVVGEEVVPGLGIGVERVVEDKEDVRVHLADLITSFTVEVLENIKVGGPPGLVDRLKSVESGVVSPLSHKGSDVVESPLDVAIVDVIVA